MSASSKSSLRVLPTEPLGSPRIRVVAADAGERARIVDTLRSLGEVASADPYADVASREPSQRPPDLVVISLPEVTLPSGERAQLLRETLEREPASPLLVISPDASFASAVAAMRSGALDFLRTPFAPHQLELCAARILARATRSRTALRSNRGNSHRRTTQLESGPIYVSEAMRAVVDRAERAAATRSTVLITGETGTGKEVIASLIHRVSREAEAPLVKVSCAALPETLLESELFGHERGAFTGAEQRRIGRFEQAEGGTIFLDEIGELSSSTQAKLLRVLQERELQRLGGSETLRTDVRVIAATHRDLEAALIDGSFREDLFFRMNVIDIHIPPLRERPEDAVLLAEHFLEELSGRSGRPCRKLSEAALARIRTHRWRGNVRELQNVIERALLSGGAGPIEGNEIGGGEAARLVESLQQSREARRDLPPGGISLQDVECEVILRALEQSDFVQKDAALLLQISRRKLNYMIGRLGITHTSWRRNRHAAEGVEDASDGVSCEGPNSRRT